MGRALAAALALLLAACPSVEPADLTIAQDAEPQTLDPARMTGVGEGRIASVLFEGLTRLDPETLEVRPGVAREWGVSADGLVWTFRLRNDARWSDGRPVTAADFRDSWLRLLDPQTASAYAGLLFPVRGARAYQAGEGAPEAVGLQVKDPFTFVVTLDHTVSYFDSLTAFFSLLPVPMPTVREHGDRWTREGNLVGNGPFVLARHRFYRDLLLRRSPTYWNRAEVRLASLRLLPVPDPGTQLNLYATGEVDVATSVPSSVVAALRARRDYVSGPRLATAFLRVNVTRPPLDRPALRRALAAAVDRDLLVARIVRGGEPVAESFVPPVLPGYHPPRVQRFDPGAAVAELRGAGFGPGAAVRPITLLLSQNPDHAALATVLQAAFRQQLGLDVRLDVREWKVYQSAMRNLEYDLAFSQWFGDYPDETTFLDCFKSGNGNNRTGYRDKGYDDLLDRAAAPAPGEDPAAYRARRSALHADAERRLLLAAPIVTLYHPTARFLVAPRVGGFRPNVMGLIRFDELRVREQEE